MILSRPTTSSSSSSTSSSTPASPAQLTLREQLAVLLQRLSGVPGAGKIPIADANGRLDAWVTATGGGSSMGFLMTVMPEMGLISFEGVDYSLGLELIVLTG